MSLPKLKGIPKGIAWLSMVGLLSLMFAGPAVATVGQDEENPNPAGSVSFVQSNCTKDKVAVNITDSTPPGVGTGYAGIMYYLTSTRGAESETADSIDRLSSVTLNSKPMAFGETVTFTVKARLDTPQGSPQLVVIDSFTTTRKNCEPPPPVTCQSDATGLTGSAVVVGNTVTYKASLPKKACADTWVANGDTYRVADTYDGSGNFNASSTPQHFFPETRVDLVIKKGEKNVTEVRQVPVSCWWVQADTYTGKKIDIVGPGGHGGQFLGGGFKKLSNNKCEIQPPINTKVTPVAPVVIDQVIVCTIDFTLKTTSASITPAVTKGVEYLLDGKVVTVTVLVQPGTHTFEARALEGSVLTAPMNLFLGVNAGVAPVCKKPEVVPPPVVTPPVVVPPVVTPPVVAPPATPPTKVVVIVKRPTRLPIPTKVQTDGGELMSSKTSGSGVLPFIIGFGLLIAGGLTFKLRRREARN